MNKESYEKEIHRLEKSLENVKRNNESLRESNETLRYEMACEREHVLQGLLGFLNNLHTKLGGMQVDILRQLTSLNEQLVVSSTERGEEAAKTMEKLLALGMKKTQTLEHDA